jgi:hypothetical protein
MFELVAAAVVAVFVSCLYPIARGFFRSVEEMSVSRLATTQRSVKRKPAGLSENRRARERAH